MIVSFFFFKQKTAYEMRISDWSSDVCSSDLAAEAEALAKRLTLYRLRRPITIEPAGGAVHWAVEGAEGVPDPRLPELGRRWLGAVGAAADDWAEHRLRLGVTEGVAELGSGETLWLECNAAELGGVSRSEEHTYELQSLMRISYAVFCLKKKKKTN